MKTTIDLPADLTRMVKIQAAARNRTVDDLVIEFVEEGLGRSGISPVFTDRSRIQISQNGLPGFRCRGDAPAALMGLNDLLAHEQSSQAEEDGARVGIPL